MADPTRRNPANSPGSFYVDDSCIDCGMCSQTAPDIFKLDVASGTSIVHRQPGNEEEILLAEEAMTSCPTESIGRHQALDS